MEYVITTVEKAQKIAKPDAIVLVAVTDLEKGNYNDGFTKKKFCECEGIINDAKTIAKICDDFVNQLRVFSERQVDVIAFEPRGKMSTILIPQIL